MNKAIPNDPSSETPEQHDIVRTHAPEPKLETVLKFKGVYCYAIKPIEPEEPIDQDTEELTADQPSAPPIDGEQNDTDHHSCRVQADDRRRWFDWVPRLTASLFLTP